MWRSIPFMFLFGCGTGLVSYPGESETGEAGPVFVASITPDYGTPDGGTDVTITGEGFDGSVAVRFGSYDVPVIKLDSQTLLVTTPAVGAEIDVDVFVESALGEDVVVGGFTFTRGGDPDPDPDPEDTGSVVDGIGGVVQFTLLQIACPDCFGYTTSIDVAASAGFHDPSSGSWTSWLPTVGSCTTNLAPTAPADTLLDVGEWVYLTAGSTSIGLRKSNGEMGPSYSVAGLSSDDFKRSTAFDISVPDGGAFGEGFEVVDATLTPQGFTAITPEAMLYVDPMYAFSAMISASNATIQWAPYGGDDSVVVLLDAYHPSSGTYLGSVLCRGADTGSLRIPSTYLTGFPNGSYLGISIQRYAITESVIPVNGAILESVSQIGVLGTGTLRP